MNSLSPSMQRALALAILLAALGLVINYLIIPLYHHYIEQWQDLERSETELRRFQRLLNNEDLINKEIKRIDELGASGDLFLAGNKKAIASANLREFVNEVIDRSGGRVISSQDYEAEAVQSATPIGLRLQITGEIENLVDFLHGLENARPLIFIDNLTVTSSSGRVNRILRRSQRRVNQNISSLDIRLDIVGYLAGEQN